MSSVIGTVPVHVNQYTRLEVQEGETSTWLSIGKGEVCFFADTPEVADYLALKVSALANRMRERAAKAAAGGGGGAVSRPFDLAEMESAG